MFRENLKASDAIPSTRWEGCNAFQCVFFLLHTLIERRICAACAPPFRSPSACAFLPLGGSSKTRGAKNIKEQKKMMKKLGASFLFPKSPPFLLLRFVDTDIFSCKCVCVCVCASTTRHMVDRRCFFRSFFATWFFFLFFSIYSRISWTPGVSIYSLEGRDECPARVRRRQRAPTIDQKKWEKKKLG